MDNNRDFELLTLNRNSIFWYTHVHLHFARFLSLCSINILYIADKHEKGLFSCFLLVKIVIHMSLSPTNCLPVNQWTKYKYWLYCIHFWVNLNKGESIIKEDPLPAPNKKLPTYDTTKNKNAYSKNSIN